MPRRARHELEGHDVIMATGRASRPGAIDGPRDGRCPFCRGNEDDTPPEIARWPLDQEWFMRLVPNRYPAVTADGELRGHHEVLIETPLHGASPFEFSASSLADIFAIYGHRLRMHAATFPYVLAFKNSGSAAGETIQHPHSQIIALDVQRARPRQPFHNGEAPRSELIVASDGEMTLWCPSGSRFSFELAITTTATRLIDADAAAVGRLMRLALTACRTLFGICAFNWYVAAERGIDEQALSIVPRLNGVAGFELASGWWINVTEPRDAARRLREALEERSGALLEF